MSLFENKRLLTTMLLAVAAIVCFVSLSWVETNYGVKRLNKIIVNIQNEYENYFIDEKEVIALATNNDRELMINKDYDSINLKKIEQRILQHHFVDEAQVYKDLKGNLLIDIKQSRPLARIIPNDGIGGYVSDEGETLMTSDRFTARVMIIDGYFTKKMMEPDFFYSELGRPYFEMIQYIHQNEFWKTQVAQLSINRIGEIVITPQVGNEEIEFGLPDRFQEKFNKLHLFYKKILPTVGWSIYKKVKLNYKNQIVCEKA